jgi:hypothetical protein
MFESIAYISLAFAVTFLSLEAGWHFTACKYKSLKPCFYKRVCVIMRSVQVSANEIVKSNHSTVLLNGFSIVLLVLLVIEYTGYFW